MSLKDPDVRVFAMEVAITNYVDDPELAFFQDQAMQYGLASDEQATRQGYEFMPHILVELTLVCTLLTSVFYLLCCIFGKLKFAHHNGLKLFWTCMSYGEIIACFGSLLTMYILGFANSESLTFICADIEYNTLKLQSSYLWLFVWTIFVMSMLRSVTSVTWLHRMTNPNKIRDMTRGIGVLTMSLIYLLPLALMGQASILSTATNELYEKMPYAVCVPVWSGFFSQSLTCQIMTGLTYWIGILIGYITVSRKTPKHITKSTLAAPLVTLTHFLPVFVTSVYMSNWVENQGLPHVFPLIFVAISAINSMCNFCCYKLFVLSNTEPETCKFLDKSSYEYDCFQIKESKMSTLGDKDSDDKLLCLDIEDP